MWNAPLRRVGKAIDRASPAPIIEPFVPGVRPLTGFAGPRGRKTGGVVNSFVDRFEVRRAAVLGAGVMGAQIAAHLANAGVPVLLFDLAAREGPPNGIVMRALDGLKSLEPAPLASGDALAAIEACNNEHDHAGGRHGAPLSPFPPTIPASPSKQPPANAPERYFFLAGGLGASLAATSAATRLSKAGVIVIPSR